MIPRVAVSSFVILVCSFAFAADYQTGWPVSIGSNRFTLANVDDDPEPEVIATGGLHVFNGDGTESAPWPYLLAGQDLPLVGDLDGDGEKDIVFKLAGTTYGAISASGVQKAGWPITLSQHLSLGQPSIALADLDGDGDDDFLALSLVDDHMVYGIDDDGTPLPGWPRVLPITLSPTESLFWTSLGAGDIDFDGMTDIMVGLYMRDGPFLIPSPCYVMRADGTIPDGWPAVPPFHYSWQQLTHPMMADLSGNLECEVFGAGFMDLHGFGLDGSVYFPAVPAPFASRPGACGDVDGNGTLEIVMPGERLRVFSAQGLLLAESDPADYWLYDGITLGDTDGDGDQEICAISLKVGSDTAVWIHLLDHQTLEDLPGWPKYLGAIAGNQFHTTALGDLDGDNDLEVLTAYGGMIHAWDEPNPTGGPVSCEWPMWGHDAKKSMFYHQGNIPIAQHLPGDVNGDLSLDLADPIALIAHLFVAPLETNCLAAFDFNGSGGIDVADPIAILGYLFGGTPPPGGPPVCGSSAGNPLSCTRTTCP